MGFGGSEGVAGVLHDPCFFLTMLCIVFTTHAAAATPHASGAQDAEAATPTPGTRPLAVAQRPARPGSGCRMRAALGTAFSALTLGHPWCPVRVCSG